MQINNPIVNYSDEDLVAFYQNKLIKYWIKSKHPEIIDKCRELAEDYIKEINNVELQNN